MTTPCSGGVAWTNYPATKTLTPYRTCTPGSLDDIVAIVREAETANKHVHAFGSAWSFSDCAITMDYLVDSRLLNRPVQTVQEALLPGQSHLVYHVEAGMTIRNIYTQLGLLGAALETMGGASGQTIAGATSTGTHGGDLFMPPLADSVLALHMVGAGGAVYWVEPSQGITDPVLLQKWTAPASLEATTSANCYLSYQVPVPYSGFPRTLSAAYHRNMSEASPHYTKIPSPSWRASHHRLPAIPS
jgi:hypothetical protein